MTYIQIQFIIELLCLCVQPLPFYERWVHRPYLERTIRVIYDKDKTIHYFLSDYLLIVMFTRIIFIFRTLLNNSIYRDEYSKKICSYHGVNSGIRFTFKCLLEDYPELSLFSLFLSTVMILAYVLRVLELPYQFLMYKIDGNNYEFSLAEQYFLYTYFVVITITTVGYGDMIAKSLAGRWVVMLTAIWGAILISLIVLVVGSVFELKKSQKKAMHDIHVTRKATRAISLSIKFFLMKKKYYLTMLKLNSDVYRNSEFMKLLKSKPLDAIEEMSIDQNEERERRSLTSLMRSQTLGKNRRNLERIRYKDMQIAYGQLQKELDEFSLIR